MEWRNVGLRGNTNTLGYVSTKIEKRKPTPAYCTKTPYNIPCRLCNFHIGNRTDVHNSVFVQKTEWTSLQYIVYNQIVNYHILCQVVLLDSANISLILTYFSLFCATLNLFSIILSYILPYLCNFNTQLCTIHNNNDYNLAFIVQKYYTILYL